LPLLHSTTLKHTQIYQALNITTTKHIKYTLTEIGMANPFAAETELLVLRLLSSEPNGLYGLEMVKSSDGRLKRGTVYVTLGRLVDKGYIKSRIQSDADHPGLPRPRYTLTGQGQKVLQAAELMGWQLVRA
jgi:PadR family transcriptional regulator PadR